MTNQKHTGFIDSSTERYILAARRIHEAEGEVEIDDNAVVSESEDGGAYVQAWVWVGQYELAN